MEAGPSRPSRDSVTLRRPEETHVLSGTGGGSLAGLKKPTVSGTVSAVLRLTQRACGSLPVLPELWLHIKHLWN